MRSTVSVPIGVDGRTVGGARGGQPPRCGLLRGGRALPRGAGEHAGRRDRARPGRARGPRERGALPRDGRHGPGVHLDGGRQGPDRLREPRLAGLHGPLDRRGARRHLGPGRAPRGRGGRALHLVACVQAARAVGARVPAAPPRRRVPLDHRPRGAALPRRRAHGLRRHRLRHPRAQGDGGEAQPGGGRRPRGGGGAPALAAAGEPAGDRRGGARGALPAREPRRRDRRGLVRRDRAGGRPSGRRGRRRGGPRPARRHGDGPAAKRVPRVRPRGDLSGADAGAAQPPALQGRPRPDGHGPLRRHRPRYGRAGGGQRRASAPAGDRVGVARALHRGRPLRAARHRRSRRPTGSPPRSWSPAPR